MQRGDGEPTTASIRPHVWFLIAKPSGTANSMAAYSSLADSSELADSITRPTDCSPDGEAGAVSITSIEKVGNHNGRVSWLLRSGPLLMGKHIYTISLRYCTMHEIIFRLNYGQISHAPHAAPFA